MKAAMKIELSRLLLAASLNTGGFEFLRADKIQPT